MSRYAVPALLGAYNCSTIFTGQNKAEVVLNSKSDFHKLPCLE